MCTKYFRKKYVAADLICGIKSRIEENVSKYFRNLTLTFGGRVTTVCRFCYARKIEVKKANISDKKQWVTLQCRVVCKASEDSLRVFDNVGCLL